MLSTNRESYGPSEDLRSVYLHPSSPMWNSHPEHLPNQAARMNMDIAIISLRSSTLALTHSLAISLAYI